MASTRFENEYCEVVLFFVAVNGTDVANGTVQVLRVSKKISYQCPLEVLTSDL